MRYALVAPVLLAVTALAAPVPDGNAAGPAQRSEGLNIDGLSVSHLDVPPNVNIKNIPRSEDVSVNDVIPVDIGVPTILRRGDGDGELSAVTGVLDDLGLGDILKRDHSLLTDDDFLGVDVNSLLKRDDSLLGGGDNNGHGGILDVNLDIKRDDSLLGGGDNNGHGGILDVNLDIKRDDSLLGGDDVIDLLKRKEETSIGGIGSFDLGTPILDSENV